jgi:L-fucose mutarotase/ribose pyranase (RbsD/FucU family)
MGVIDETAQWAVSVYQIEAGDPTIGGPDAPDNVQARALADRTLYLKGEIETLEATVAAIDLSGYLETADLLDAITAVDGAGSGLDADTLDGLQASQFLRSDANDTITATLTANRLDAAFVTGGGDELFVAAGDFADHAEGNQLSEVLYLAGDAGVKAITSSDNLASGWAGRHEATLLDIYGNSDFPGRISSNGNAVWHAGNDGAGSGLDADTLDGLQASQFLRSDANDTITATLTANQLDAAFVTGGGDELFVAAGDFAEHAEGNLLSEVLYLAGDAGVKAITSSDNLASGWAGRHEATLLDTQGNTHFPGRVYIAGGQTWLQIQRLPNTLHLNTLGTAISVSILLGEGQHFEIWDGIAYTRQYTSDRETDSGAFLGEITIPNGWGWRLVGGSAVQAWELR